MLSRSQIIGFPIVLIHFEHPRGGQPLYKGHNSWVYIVPKVSFVQRLDCTTNLKLQTERRMSYELQTANCTPHALLTLYRRHYVELILFSIPSPDYSQQISIFMKQPCSTHNCFCSAREREIVCVRLELTTLTLSARLQYLSKKKKKLSLWGSNSRPSHYSTTLYHTEADPICMYHGGQKETNF